MKRREYSAPTLSQAEQTSASGLVVLVIVPIATGSWTPSSWARKTSIMKVIVGVRHGEFKRKYNMIVESPTGAPLKYVPLGIQMRRWHGLAVECELAGSVRNAVGYACKVRPTRGGGTG